MEHIHKLFANLIIFAKDFGFTGVFGRINGAEEVHEIELNTYDRLFICRHFTDSDETITEAILHEDIHHVKPVVFAEVRPSIWLKIHEAAELDVFLVPCVARTHKVLRVF